MAYLYDWNGMPMPPTRTPPELSDWPPVWNSGPERDSQASIMPPTTFHRGPVPTGGLLTDDAGNVDMGKAIAVGLLAVGAWWWFIRKPSKPVVITRTVIPLAQTKPKGTKLTRRESSAWGGGGRHKGVTASGFGSR